jgi:hypothetical protein
MSNTPKGNGERELAYHLHVLLKSEVPDIDAKLQATASIKKHTRESIGPLDASFADLLRVYQETENERLKAELAELVVYQWPTRTEVQLLLHSALTARDLPPTIVQSFLFSLHGRLDKQPSLALDIGIQQFAQKAYALLPGQEIEESEEEQLVPAHVMIFMKSLIVALDAQRRGQEKLDGISLAVAHQLVQQSDTREGRLLRKALRQYFGEEDYNTWLQKLRVLFRRSRQFTDPRLAMNTHDVLTIMSKPREDSRQQVAALNRKALEGLLGEDPKPIFSPQGTRLLAEQIKEKGSLPATLLADLFVEHDRQFVLLHGLTDEMIVRLPNLVADIDARTPLTHLAIHIPPQLQSVFERFLQGEDSMEVVSMLHGTNSGFLKETLENYKDERDRLREAILQVKAVTDLQIVPVGTELSGELGLDEQTTLMKNIVRYHRDARMLVLSHPVFHFAFDSSRAHVTGIEGKRFSYAPKLIEAFGEQKIASVLALDGDEAWMRKDSWSGQDDIASFCRRYNIASSFGVRPAETMLKNIRFEETADQTYEEAWDGLLVFLKRNQDEKPLLESPPAPSSRVPVLSST